ncbi:Lipoprotein signal peptidase [bioreactor metagenome]|uniref:Lipoprotein signal peptidase n=1 Tax=bioreactor metagenome TaxID=1076179 RepID=A0A645I3W4_9ZZZZ
MSKYLIHVNLSPVGTSLPLIDGFVQFTNVHNTGAAWGMLSGFRWLFIPMTLIVAGILLLIVIRFHKKLCVFSRVTLALLFSGAIGNFIDRLLLGYVRDFIDITPWFSFPVFNVADSALSIGCVFLVIDALFLKDQSLFDRVSLQLPKKEHSAGGSKNEEDGQPKETPSEENHA